ncbi:MAG: hypothetical protein B6241_12285 [Spirochaetaceae bacterium 4572_59]|nr:MAG: hypothetical protein B6241_12285 [Spirochaetaceae bacterium 4572_59]
MSDNRDLIRTKDEDIFRLEEILALLSWDQETGMPEKAIEGRSDQMAWIQRQISDRITDPQWESLLLSLNSKAKSLEDKVWSENLSRRYRLNKCLPVEFMSEFVRTTSIARDAWQQARKEEDFSLFQPYLEKVVDMVRKRAELTGYDGEPYNALLDIYEPGMTADKLESIFNPLQEALIPLIDKAIFLQEPKAPGVFSYDVEKQKKLHLQLLDKMGYDLRRGRMDFSVHPFTTTPGSKDIRITTHLMEDDFLNGLYSTMHEGGHGLYEQNLPALWARTMNGQACSLGFHESQSRLWENIIGRSRAFWDYFAPLMKNYFPQQMRGQNETSLFLFSNRVERSLIRVDADEFTYNLHIILRFRLERMIVNGEAKVSELPELWKEESRKLLEVVPETLCEGVLQDIHWSLGDWGYFPTYTLGNLYSAQLWASLKRDIPHVDSRIGQGDFSTILSWLTEHVHQSASMLSPDKMIKEISGETLNSRYFIDYLKGKLNDLYAD